MTRTHTTAAVARLAATRDSLHRVAEHVLAAAQYADTGRIRLRVAPGGFETWDRLAGGQRVRIVDGRLVVDGHGERTAPLTTVRAAAEFVGTVPGLPPKAYRPATPLEEDAPLHIDDASARALADFWTFADAALRRFAEHTGRPAEPVLWPEHFDVGITIGTVNYGGSPGDARIVQPYLYVGPHGGPPGRDDFWNADFGAARMRDDVRSLDEAVGFFDNGRVRAEAAGLQR